jgi:hypothetical protein
MTAQDIRTAADFITRLAELSATEWAAILRRRFAVDPGARLAAVRRLFDAATAHQQSRALHQLDRAARGVVEVVGLPELDRPAAVALATRATLAIALADLLDGRDVALLCAPFAPTAPGELRSSASHVSTIARGGAPQTLPLTGGSSRTGS